MVPSSICADAPLPCYRGVGRWCCGVWARVSEGGGATVVGCKDSRVRADYTIGGCESHVRGWFLPVFWGGCGGVDEAENKICMVRA